MLFVIERWLDGLEAFLHITFGAASGYFIHHRFARAHSVWSSPHLGDGRSHNAQLAHEIKAAQDWLNDRSAEANVLRRILLSHFRDRIRSDASWIVGKPTFDMYVAGVLNGLGVTLDPSELLDPDLD